MSDSAREDLLARLAGADGTGGDNPWAAVEASKPSHEDSPGAPVATSVPEEADEEAPDEKLSALLERINQISDVETNAGTGQRDSMAPPDSGAKPGDDYAFIPIEPDSFSEAGVTDTEVEALILKFLLGRGEATGREVTDQISLPFRLLDEQLQVMKHDRSVAHRGAAAMNDYVYHLTDLGRERARRYSDHCTYFGSAPVTLNSYIESVGKQSLVLQHPTADDLGRAFSDLLINNRMLGRLGPAINSGRGLFLYGAAGNGKTSIAERLTLSFGKHIWIPRAIGVDGEIIRLFDPRHHEVAPLDNTGGLIDHRKIDKRWVRILRPTIVVGGELTMDNLELTKNTTTGVSEAPVQMKSNCGTLVIDDFGRQRMSTDELLNRWIVPLEKRYDFLNMANGKKIQVPFDQLIVFSTNLEPKDLVDDAFLRRIPYKIHVGDPTEEEFRELFKMMAPKFDLEYKEDVFEYLVEEHYKKAGRPFRCCQPRDLLLQIRNFCFYTKSDLEMSREFVDLAVENYFAIM